MKIGYFEPFSGASGDMIIGALLDAGLDFERLKMQLEKINIEGYNISAEKVKRGAITGTKFNCNYDPKQESDRNLDDILEIINSSELSKFVKEKSSQIFKKLAAAEAKVHGIEESKVTFHEIGAVDSIIDIVGACLGLELLSIEKVFSQLLTLGSGYVECKHGKLPVPAPATLELLRGIKIRKTNIERELVTPTGAAILTTFVDEFGIIPDMRLESVGYGAGSANTKELPNLLRVNIAKVEQDVEKDFVWVIETEIDDMAPEFYEYLFEKLFEKNALDVYTTPITMKKSRPAHLITIVSTHEALEKIENVLFQETTTFGLRKYMSERRKLNREIEEVETEFGKVKVKIGRIDDKVVSISPEYENCKTIAEKEGIPLKKVFEIVKTKVYHKNLAPLH